VLDRDPDAPVAMGGASTFDAASVKLLWPIVCGQLS